MGDILKITKNGKFADSNPGFPIVSVLKGQVIEVPNSKMTDFQIQSILDEGHGELTTKAGDSIKSMTTDVLCSEPTTVANDTEISLDANTETAEDFQARLERISAALIEKAAVNEKLAMIGTELGVSIHKGKRVEDNIQILVDKFKEKYNV